MTDEELGSELGKALTLLDNDIEALGWDKPAALWEIHGDFNDDPTFVKTLELEDPRRQLEDLTWSVQLADKVVGLVFASEAWRSVSLEEALNSEDESLRELADAIKTAVVAMCEGDAVPEEDIEKLVNQGWISSLARLCDNRFSTLPDPWRREVRTLMAVDREGNLVGLMRERGEEAPSSTEFGTVQTNGGFIPDMLGKLLGIKYEGQS